VRLRWSKKPDGCVMHSSSMTDAVWLAGYFGRLGVAQKPGWYVMFGDWKGPFETEAEARSAHAEWAWEARWS